MDTSGKRTKGLFERKDFRYRPEVNAYRCPANEVLKWRMTSEEAGKTLHRYWSSRCPACSLKSRCTTGKERRVTRWEHEALLETMQAGLDQDPGKMRTRRSTVEHPYGTIKAWMGATHFLTKTLSRVSTEMSLHVLAYNLKRMMRIMGTGSLIQAIQA